VSKRRTAGRKVKITGSLRTGLRQLLRQTTA